MKKQLFFYLFFFLLVCAPTPENTHHNALMYLLEHNGPFNTIVVFESLAFLTDACLFLPLEHVICLAKNVCETCQNMPIP